MSAGDSDPKAAMTSMAISGEASCTLETALDHLVAALHAHGFNVYSKLDILCHLPERRSPASGILLRAIYPRTEAPVSLTRPDSRRVIHCSAILRELHPSRVWIELDKPIRRLNRRNLETVRRAYEADRELRSIMTQLVEIEFPLKTP